MSWNTGYTITGGELEGSIIGVTNFLTDTTTGDINISRGESYRNQSGDLEWYNTNFDKQIDITSIVSAQTSPQGGKVIAKINLYNNYNEITGRFVFKLLLIDTTYFWYTCYIEDPDGNILGYVPRNTPSQGWSFPLNRAQTKRLFYLAFCIVYTQDTYYDIGWIVNSSSIEENSQGWKWGERQFRGGAFNLRNIHDMYGIYGTLPVPERDSPEFGPASQPGGGYVPGGGYTPGGGQPKVPSFDNSSDKVEISTKPYTNPCDAQFLKVWLMDGTDLAHLGDALFPQYDLTDLDILGTWKEIAEMLLNNKRIDYVLDLLIVPVVPDHATNKQHITCGGWTLYYYGNEEVPVMHYVDGKLVHDCYVDFTCGSISIDEYWVNFLDFSGTRVKLFLPYIGYVDIQPEYVIGGTLYVDYRFNVFDGSFMVFVRSDSGYSELEESLIGQYAGVAAVHIPLQSQDYSNKISGLISAVGSVAAAGMGATSVAGAVGAGANLGNTLVQKPGSVHANGYNASSSFLSHRKPYLIIERQWSQFSEKYPEEVGMPSNVMCRLGDLYGLVKSANAHLDVIPCTVEGKEKISKLLADGIIL